MRLLIVTQRLTLRPFEAADARRIAYLAGEYDVARMCGRVPSPYSLAHAQEWIAGHDRLRQRGQEYPFAITLTRDGLIGSCGVTRMPGVEAWEIGYWLGMPYWGQGFASDVARAVMDWAGAASNSMRRRSPPGIFSTTRPQGRCCASWALSIPARASSSGWRAAARRRSNAMSGRRPPPATAALTWPRILQHTGGRDETGDCNAPAAPAAVRP